MAGEHIPCILILVPVPVVGTCTNGDIRLVGGSSDREGRVEICYNNQWGAVCDDLWGSDDARVACRQLGHSPYGASYFRYSYFGRSTGGIFLDDVFCSGSESRLIDCRHDGIGVHNCDHSDDAGVRCQERTTACTHGEVRLVNGLTGGDGRVEMCLEGTWGTVCDDGWGVNDARVVCRQLGFSSGIGVQALSYAYFGQGSGPILLSYVGCNGEEMSLLNCSYSLSVTSCYHSEDAGIRCPVPVDTNIICTKNQWGTVCDDYWNTNVAMVACRQLGFTSYGARAFFNSNFGHGFGPILLDNVRCTGGESRLIDCSHSGVGVHDRSCDHSDDAGVRCIERGNCTEGEIRLKEGSNNREGRVEICIEGLWGTICDTSWDSRDASVVCQQLGFGPSLGAIPFINSCFGRGSGPIWLDSLFCTGNENNLLNCSHRGIGVTNYYCDHRDDVGVQCPGVPRPFVESVVTVVLTIDGTNSPTPEDIEVIIEDLEDFIQSFCDVNREECEYIDDETTGATKRSQFTRDAGVEIHVVSLTITEDGTIELTFFVTTPEGVLSGSSLQQIIEEAAQPDGVLSQHGVTVLDIQGPTTESTEESSNNSKSIIIGVVVGITGCVILVGAVGFFIWIWRNRCKNGIKPDAHEYSGTGIDNQVYEPGHIETTKDTVAGTQSEKLDNHTVGFAIFSNSGTGIEKQIHEPEYIEVVKIGGSQTKEDALQLDNHTVGIVVLANHHAEITEMEPQSVIPNEDTSFEDTSSDNTSCESYDE